MIFIFFMIFCCGGFCPNKKSTVSYVYHCSKVSYRSSFVFGGILSRGGFFPATTLPYSMYSNTVNIHIEQHMFWKDWKFWFIHALSFTVSKYFRKRVNCSWCWKFQYKWHIKRGKEGWWEIFCDKSWILMNFKIIDWLEV